MQKNNSWTVIVFSIVITTVLWALLSSVWAFIYWLYIQVIDFKDQMYLSLKSESFLEKQLVDYVNDPLTYSLRLSEYGEKSNFEFNNNSRYVNEFTDLITPMKQSFFMMTSFDNESSYLLNKIKKNIVYFNKQWEYWNLTINLLKYNEDFPSDMQTWNIVLYYDDSSYCSDIPSFWPNNEYKCSYEIMDFNYSFNNNSYDYFIFFNSDDLVTYSILAYDSNNQQVKLPSRYLDMDFNTHTSTKSLSKNTNKKLDLYSKYKLNINNSLYKLN